MTLCRQHNRSLHQPMASQSLHQPSAQNKPICRSFGPSLYQPIASPGHRLTSPSLNDPMSSTQSVAPLANGTPIAPPPQQSNRPICRSSSPLLQQPIARLGHRLTSPSLNQQSLFLLNTCSSIPANRSASTSLLLPIAPPANRISRSSPEQPIAHSAYALHAHHLLVHPSQHIAHPAHRSLV